MCKPKIDFKGSCFVRISAELNLFRTVMAYVLDVVDFWVIQSTGFSLKYLTTVVNAGTIV
jgi:hypothetical protein